MDYKNGKIYRLVCNVSGKQYIGSTTQTLTKRKCCHKSDYKKWKNGNHNYIKSFDILQNDDCDIILIENYPCQSKNELERRERYWIENMVCVNKNIPGRTQEEWKGENKEKLKEYAKQYYGDNKEYFQQYRETNKEYIQQKENCECGGKFTRQNKQTHLKSKKHQKWEQEQQK